MIHKHDIGISSTVRNSFVHFISLASVLYSLHYWTGEGCKWEEEGTDWRERGRKKDRSGRKRKGKRRWGGKDGARDRQTDREREGRRENLCV